MALITPTGTSRSGSNWRKGKPRDCVTGDTNRRLPCFRYDFLLKVFCLDYVDEQRLEAHRICLTVGHSLKQNF